MLSARNVVGRKVVFDEYRLISPSAFDEENRRTTVTEGDVLLTIVGAIGRSAVVTAGYPPFTLQRSVAVVRQKAGDPRFLSYSFQAPLFQQYLNENAKGTAQKGIYLKALAGAKVPFAPVCWRRPKTDQENRVVPTEY
jgi:type I restriction enzyme S subunit